MSEQQVPGRHLGEERAPEGAVCVACGTPIAPRHWARHSDAGWRHDVCPTDVAQAE